MDLATLMHSQTAPSKNRSKPRNGVALVIVLSFIILLTLLVVAFFTTAINEQQIATSSHKQTEVDLFAQGAVDTLLGDLRQEIAAGSEPGLNLPKIYFPTSPATVSPALVGSHPALPNLIKRSAAKLPFFSGPNYNVEKYPPSDRALEVSSEVMSLNGRSISKERWNKHLFLPKEPAEIRNDTSTAPNAAFIAPDWILVGRDATNPKAASAGVIGRYAYAIYDEGGVLDINVAGHPLNLPGLRPIPPQMTEAQAAAVSRKGSLAFADLTQIGLSRAQADQITGWRNYATARPEGALPKLAFDTDPERAAMDRYIRAMIAQPLGFLGTANTGLYNNQSDHSFTSRQQLIHFLQRLLAVNPSQRAKLQTTLQYLGTFSRDRNQPSFAPDPLRPRIQGSMPASSDISTYTGNNNAQGQDDLINPQFLTVRVNKHFTRNDGSSAAPGEPFVKKRFPLSRLSLLTGNAVADKESEIYRLFGLTRNSANQPWLYSHGIANRMIAQLQDVAALAGARDADCVELLKAGINAGSLGKAAATDGLAGAYNQRRDISVDYQVLQIFANLIDQFDADGVPTRIALPDGTLFCGIENLPYFYRYRVGPVQARLPVPLGTGDWKPVPNSPRLSDEGLGVFLLFPELWNPHDQNSSMGLPRPSNFRLLVEATEPGQNGRTGSVTTTPQMITDKAPGIKPSQPSRPAALNATTSEMLFSVPDASVFREPTLLDQAGQPNGSRLTTGPGHLLRTLPGVSSDGGIRDAMQVMAATDLNTGNAPGFIGAYLGSFPLRKLQGSTIYSAGTLEAHLSTASMMVRMQYQNDAGTWITYDQKAISIPSFVSALNGAHPGVAPNGILTGESNTWGQCSDPRTTRFGFATAGPSEPPQTGVLDAASGALKTSRPDRHSGWTASAAGVPGQALNPRPSNGSLGWAPAPLHFDSANVRWASGLLAQNRTDVFNDGMSDQSPLGAHRVDPVFYIDPDGIPRRGAAAYVLSGITAAGSLNSAITEIGLPLATATTYPASTPTRLSQNRPIVLNRPFRSVADLGYVFRDQPWKELDFFTPESGDTALLDLFSVQEDSTDNGIIAGKLNLNTRHVPVLKAVLSGAYIDELAALPKPDWARDTLGPLSATEIDRIAHALVRRTHDLEPNRGPLRNLGELVGKYIRGYQAPSSMAAYQPNQPFDGFSADLSYDGAVTAPANLVARFRESAVRALADVGTVRVWNLMIDLVAQSGRYPRDSNNPANFIVAGEKRLWVHIAIDRYTGEVIDRQVEVVRE